MFRYRLYTPDGDEIGEATYAMMPFDEDDEAPFVGLLEVEAA